MLESLFYLNFLKNYDKNYLILSKCAYLDLLFINKVKEIKSYVLDILRAKSLAKISSIIIKCQ